MSDSFTRSELLSKYRIAPQDATTRLFLKYYTIKKDAKVLVLNSFANNIPAILADKGCSVVAVDNRKPSISPPDSEGGSYKKVARPYSKLEASREGFDVITCFHTLQFYKTGWFSEEKDYSAHEVLVRVLAKSLRRNGLLFLSLPVGHGHSDAPEMRVFSAEGLKGLGLDSLKCIELLYARSCYPQSGGHDSSVKILTEAEVNDPENTLPSEMFCIYKKVGK